MKKEFWKSKTVWGAFLFAASSFVVQVGWFPENLISELVKWFGATFGVYGLRDALD